MLGYKRKDLLFVQKDQPVQGGQALHQLQMVQMVHEVREVQGDQRLRSVQVLRALHESQGVRRNLQFLFSVIKLSCMYMCKQIIYF